MAPRVDPNQEKLNEIAKQTLKNAGPRFTSNLPHVYLDELRKHLKFSKDDTQFSILPQPGLGYGIVYCLENGCDKLAIALGPRTGVPDDGKKDGIGSLSAYRVHIQEHPTHKQNRFARVKAENGLSSSQSSNRSIAVTSMPAPADLSIASAPKNEVVFKSRTSPSFAPRPPEPARINPKTYDSSVGSSSPASSIISRKRHFKDRDSQDTDITAPSSSPSGLHASASKKAKVGLKTETSLAPLGTVDSNAPISSVPKTHAPSSVPIHVHQAQLEETNHLIQLTQLLYSSYRNKSRKTKYDRMRMVSVGRELEEHKAKKASIEAALQSKSDALGHGFPNAAQPPVALKQPAYESDAKQFGGQPIPLGSNAYMHQSIASGSNVPIPAASLPTALPGTPFLPGPNYGDVQDSDDDYPSRYRRHSSYRGPIAQAGDIERFLVDAGNSELFDGNESVDKALEKINLKKLGEQIPMMTIPLMPHQVIGVAWMVEHERGRHQGGVLADEMGLGKTVQMIATMLLNRSDDPAVKSTLICAPVALLDQWKLEIETKTEGAFKCLIYHGPNKPKQISEVQKYHIVLTTFHTLALEYDDPRVEKRKKDKKRKGKGDSSDEFIETDSGAEKKVKKKGVLLRVPWFRVVLDEAQNIRNRKTRISIAVTKLKAQYRWCLTGTPVTNSLADCYGLVRFLAIRPWYDWDDFNKHIALIERRSPDLASQRLQAILNSCLLRRKKDSVLDGKKLIELPPKEVVLRQLGFSQEERDIYNSVEAKSQATFNRYLRAGTVLKNYAQVLVLLLRLRQLCSHPCLIQEDGYAYVRPDDDPAVKHEVQTELDRATILAGAEFVQRMKTKLRDVALQRIAVEKASEDAAIEAEECPICFDNFTDPLVTRCGHIFCSFCIESVLNQPAVEDGNQPRYGMSERPCPTCRDPIEKTMLFQRTAFEPTDTDLDISGQSSPIIVDNNNEDDGLPLGSDVFPAAKRTNNSVSAKRKGKAKAKPKKRFSQKFLESDDNFDEDDDLSDFIVQSDEDEEEKDARRELKKKLGGKNKRIVPDSDEDCEMEEEDNEDLLPPTVVVKKKGKAKRLERFLPSTKMKEMMVLLKQWAETDDSRNEKTMVLSQWTSCLDLIANYLDENGFTFVRYQGNMSRKARDEAVRTFMSQGKARIMLMSLKCGGVGLNLTRANRVISLDLGWSSAVESQAFDRVHRLGQVRPVTVQRLVIENTVEARILALQERKQNLADGSLGEGTGKKLGRLTVKDLANLFGLSAQGKVLA